MYICKGHMFVALHFIDFGVKRNPDIMVLKASLPFVVLCWFAKALEKTPHTENYSIIWRNMKGMT